MQKVLVIPSATDQHNHGLSPLPLPHILVIFRPSPTLGFIFTWAEGGKGIPLQSTVASEAAFGAEASQQGLWLYSEKLRSFTPWALSKTSADLQAFWSHNSLSWQETKPKAHHKQRISDICLFWHSWVHHFGLKGQLVWLQTSWPAVVWYSAVLLKKLRGQNQQHIDFLWA